MASVTFNNFTTGTSINDNNYLVGFASPSLGGERKYTLNTLRNSLIGNGALSLVLNSNLDPSKAVITDANGKIISSNTASIEISYLSGVTSSIQNQLNQKQTKITGAASTVTSTDLNPNRLLLSDNVGKIITSFNITTTEIDYLDGVTSNVQNQLNSKLSSSQRIPPGAIMPFAVPPNSWKASIGDRYGWLIADGSAVSRANYSDLFSVIGVTYGSGNGSTTFNLPDLRGYFIRGEGTNSDGTSSGSAGTKQNDSFKSHKHLATSTSSGSHNHTATLNDAGSHTHTVTLNNAGYHSHTVTLSNAGQHNHTYSFWSDWNGDKQFGNKNKDGRIETRSTSLAGDHTHTAYVGSAGAHTHTATLSNTGNHTHGLTLNSAGLHDHNIDVGYAGETETRPKNIAFVYAIKF
jgi:microcystin-dependent protein